MNLSKIIKLANHFSNKIARVPKLGDKFYITVWHKEDPYAKNSETENQLNHLLDYLKLQFPYIKALGPTKKYDQDQTKKYDQDQTTIQLFTKHLGGLAVLKLKSLPKKFPHFSFLIQGGSPPKVIVES